MQITIEYMIMIPLMILQILLFPYAATVIMSGWDASRQNLELQEIGSHIGSSITQLYSTLNHETIQNGTVTSIIDVPDYIEGYHYQVNGTLRLSVDEVLTSTKILDLTLTLKGTSVKSDLSVTLGQNVIWISSIYISNSSSAQLSATKLSNGTIAFSFIS